MLSEHTIRNGGGKIEIPAERKEIMDQDKRVLGRLGARELTVEELELAAGSQIVRTDNCSIITNRLTGSGDGDGCTDLVRD